jgi:hypothetical protein
MTALLISSTMFAQSTTVRGVTLSYDKVQKIMTLTIPEKVLKVIDSDSELLITIDKQYCLRMVINGVSTITYTQYFLHQGHSYNSSWIFLTIKPSNCVEVKRNYIYKFTNVQPDEYILQVSDMCDDKWESNQQSNSIIIK